MERFFESFDTWVNGDSTALNMKGWWYGPGSTSPTTYWQTSTGQVTGKSMKASAFWGASFRRQVILTSQYIIGTALRVDTLPSSTSRQFLAVMNGLTAQHLQAMIDSTGHIVIKLNGTVVYTHGTAFSVATWHYIEIEEKIDPSAGLINVWIDGSLAYSFTGNTQGSAANAFTTYFELFDCLNVPLACSLDDMYYLQSDGTVTRLGPIAIETFFPTTDGVHASWSLTGAATYHAAISGNVIATQTDWITTTTTNAWAEFDCAITMTDFPTSIYDVILNVRLDPTDVGSIELTGVIDFAGTNYKETSSVTHAANDGVLYQFDSQTDISGGSPVAWNLSSLQGGTLFGFKLAS